MVKIGCTSAKLISKLQALLSVCTIFVTQVKIGRTSAKLTSKLAISALGLHYLYPKTPTERRRTNCISAVAEPIKTPNNEIFCPHNALHALLFSKASFRVC